MCLIKKIKRNGKRILTGHPSCAKTPESEKKKRIFWHVSIVAIVNGVVIIEEFCFVGTRTQAVHYSVIKVLEKYNYNCQISHWFKVSKVIKEYS